MLSRYRQPKPDTQKFSELLEDFPKPYDCDHKPTVLGVLECINGVYVYKSWCTRCGYTGNAIKYSSLSNEQRQKAVRIDKSVAERWWSSKSQARIRKLSDLEAERKARFDRWYADYLESDVWKEKRDTVLKRDHFLCQSCLIERATEVHHLSYRHVGMEPLFELMSICRNCHEAI